MNPIWLVAKREISTRVRTRAFVLGIVATLAIIGGYVGLMTFIGSQAGSTTVGLTPSASAVEQPLERSTAALDGSLEVGVVDERTGERLVREGDLDALVTGTPDALRLVVEEEPDGAVRAALDAYAQQRALDAELLRAGADPAQVQAAVAASAVTVTSLEEADPHRGERLALAMAAGVLLYMFLIMAVTMVSQGVVEEKSSRVVELLLSTIRPVQLLTGKVLGIGLTNLLQLVIIGGAGGAVAAFSGVLTLPSSAVAGTLVWALVWFLLGYALFSALVGAAASLVSRQEDLQSVTGPVMILLVAPFVVGVAILPGDPDSTIGTWLSLVPGFSSMLMPMRIALGVATTWQILLALVLSVVGTAGVLAIGGRIYANAILRTGARVNLRDALRTA
ncbi:ABC transporter permease [Saccharopolyspora sp. CA-218241]|uniref:ABC transporter permease n=1 Tax=Saccharopolyspora sp. CA-218241 TaxID=3240027 RepID=UPI003D979D2B